MSGGHRGTSLYSLGLIEGLKSDPDLVVGPLSPILMLFLSCLCLTVLPSFLLRFLGTVLSEASSCTDVLVQTDGEKQ